MGHFVDENGCSLLDVDNPREQRLMEDTIDWFQIAPGQKLLPLKKRAASFRLRPLSDGRTHQEDST